MGAGVLLALGLAAPGIATARDGRAVMAEMQATLGHCGETAEVLMRLIDREGRTRTRRIRWQQDTGDAHSRVLARVTAPAELRGTAFLSVGEGKAEPRQWLFLPSLGRTRRIAGAQGNERFLGSDFSYADLAGLHLDAWHFKTLRASQRLTVVRATAKKGGQILEYSLDRARHLPAQIRFLDPSGTVLKVQRFFGFHKTPGGWRPEKIVMTNARSGHRTELQFEQHQTNVSLPAHTFSPRRLDRSPS